MQRAWLVSAACALSMVLGGCGGSEEPAAKSTPPADDTSSPSASPSGSATPVAQQPTGKFGVTYDFGNWDKYAENPAVVAAKRLLEAGNASLNHKRVLPGVRAGVSPTLFKQIVTTYQRGWSADWFHKRVGHVHVEKAVTKPRRSTLTLCLWDPDTQYLLKNGRAVDPPLCKVWRRQVYPMSLTGTTWRIDSVTSKGYCRGLPPP